jgi:UDP-3-O-acyl N-acetylglucosamine deacetylase
MRLMKKLFERPQRTIARSAEVHGAGYITGQHVRLRFMPAPADTGVVFVRTDLARPDLGGDARLPAHVSQVTGTQRRTTLGRPPLTVTLVEHVLAALCGLRIDNCLVELDAPEPPGLDGSAAPFVAALTAAGLVKQPEPKAVWTVEAPVLVRHQDATLTLHPAEHGELRASYLLDYGPRAPIDCQRFSTTVGPAAFQTDVAPCRTFVTQDEAVMLRQQGLGKHAKVTDLVVFGPRGPIDNRLRFANEPARHKTLDLIGDLFLAGADVRGHAVAYRSGHPLNVELARLLHERLAETSAALAA